MKTLLALLFSALSFATLAQPYQLPLPSQSIMTPWWLEDPGATNVNVSEAFQTMNTNWFWASNRIATITTDIASTSNSIASARYDIDQTNLVSHGGPDYASATETLISLAVTTNTTTHVDLAFVGRGPTNAWSGRLIFGYTRGTNDTVTLAESAGGDTEVIETDSNMDAHTLLDGTNVNVQVIGAPNEQMRWIVKGQKITVSAP